MSKNFRKSGTLALVLLALCSTPVLAATGQSSGHSSAQSSEHSSVSGVNSDSSGYNYLTFPSKETVKKDIGFIPKMTDKLSDEFSFRRGFIDLSYGKALVLEYTKTGATESQTIRLFANNLDMQIEGGTPIDNGSNPRLFYYEEEFEGYKIQRVVWKDNSINYILAVNNYSLSKDVLKEMANSVINH
ncbi:MAG: hypothetical protein ACRDBO_07135 [Lachnospiraceae bacterium]